MNFFNALNRETDIKHDFRSGDLASEIDLTSDYFVDVSGFRVDWQNPEDGWDDRKRKDLLAIHRSNLEVPRLVPTLTENGELKSGLNDEATGKKGRDSFRARNPLCAALKCPSTIAIFQEEWNHRCEQNL